MEKFWKSISAVEAKEIIKQKSHDGDFCILDVRTEKEFLGGAIPGAINLDFYASDFSQELNKLDKNKTYLIYCRSGSRSKSALAIMKQLVFEFVYELDGGIISL
ncbi:MAG: rhodanese-like domain-containing protein [Candidatus Moraniibacteriota bacterium]|jgi:rhodanese-related sulfurtransferase